MRASDESGIERILMVMAHPDDPDFSCGGTFARWAAEGKEIIYVLFTRGDKGTSDPDMTSDRLVQIREAEERAAAKVLGVKDVIFLGHPDGAGQSVSAIMNSRISDLDTVQADDISGLRAIYEIGRAHV